MGWIRALIGSVDAAIFSKRLLAAGVRWDKGSSMEKESTHPHERSPRKGLRADGFNCILESQPPRVSVVKVRQ